MISNLVRYRSPYTKVKGKPRLKMPKWKVCSPHHRQTRIDGELLDYWPTKDKWRFDGQTYYGDVREFVRDKAYEAKLLAGKSCQNCRHWLAGVLNDDIWGECAKHSTDDETKFTEASERCADHEGSKQ